MIILFSGLGRYWWIYIIPAQMRATLIPCFVPFWISSGVRVWELTVQVMMCCVVCSFPHTQQVTVLSYSTHFNRLSFVRSIPVSRGSECLANCSFEIIHRFFFVCANYRDLIIVEVQIFLRVCASRNVK